MRGLRTSNIVSSSPWNSWPSAARLAVSAVSSLVCEGMWSKITWGRGVGQPSWM